MTDSPESTPLAPPVDVSLFLVRTYSVRCSECGLVRYPTGRFTAERALTEHVIKHHPNQEVRRGIS